MADFITTETAVVVQSGFTPNLVVIAGTYTASAGSTGGLVIPGYTTSGGTTVVNGNSTSLGARNIVGCWLQPTTEDVTTPKTATAYNATYDRDAVTLTSVANGTGNYYILAYNNGA